MNRLTPSLCGRPGCLRPAVRVGLCRGCFDGQRRNGRPLPDTKPARPCLQRAGGRHVFTEADVCEACGDPRRAP